MKYLNFQDFRAQRSQAKSDMGWLKQIGKVGLPVHLLLMYYQFVIVCFDLVCISFRAYKELWLSFFYFFIPITKKSLSNELAVVSYENAMKLSVY